MTELQGTLRGPRWRVGLVTAGVATLLAGAVVVLSGTGAAAAATRYEAETAPAICNGTIDSNHTGYSGSGFCNGGEAIGSAVQFTVVAAAAGSASLGVRFANGTGRDRPANVIVNGAIVQSISFERTGAWSSWVTKALTVSVNSGSNTIAFSPTASGGLPNVDYLDFEGGSGSGTPSPTTSPPSSPPPSSPPPVDPMTAVAAMQPGWNLGNSFDAVGSDETAWGNPRVTQALITNVKAQGFNSIRIPVTWSNHHGSGPSYTIDAAWLARVTEVVNWALAADLYVMINIHHDSWQWISSMPSDRTGVLARYNALWTQIAAAFRASSPKLVFESVNEPYFINASEAQSITMLNELNTSFRNIVRGSGGNNATRLLVIPVLNTSSDQTKVDASLAWITSANDPNLIATVHFYGFWPFSVNVAGFTRFDATVQKDLTDSFDRVHNAFITRRIPVIIGEYGLLGFDRHTGTIQQGEKLKFFEFLGHYARTKQITTQWWDNGQHLGRTSLQWSDPELFAQIKSSWTSRSGTAAADHVYTAGAGTITSKTIALNLNGTSFAGVRQGSTNLVAGSDYTISGSQLTFTASALTRLHGSRAYGVNAVLHVRYSQGVDWRINIITYDTPILSSATGNTSSFAIPTQFRGDQLATMEAKYADGTNAGPHNWTSYKEFEVTFSPNYSANTITLKPEFFAEVNAGSRVTLTFHFWSGTRVTYYVTKSSNGTITGTTS